MISNRHCLRPLAHFIQYASDNLNIELLGAGNISVLNAVEFQLNHG